MSKTLSKRTMFVLEMLSLKNFARQDFDKTGCLPAYKEQIGVFSSVKKAEKAMMNAVENCSDSGVVGYVLTEQLVDCIDADELSFFESIRTYCSDGSLNYAMDCDSRCLKKFKGAKHSGRFHSGDYAFIYNEHSSCFMPSLIEKEPMSREEWHAHMDRNCAGDYTDDSFINFLPNVKGHVHSLAVMAFPASCIGAVVPKKTMKALKALRKAWLKTGI